MKNLKTTIVLLAAAVLASCSSSDTVQPAATDIIDAVFASGNVIAEQEYKVTAKNSCSTLERFESLAIILSLPPYLLKINQDAMKWRRLQLPRESRLSESCNRTSSEHRHKVDASPLQSRS